MGKNNNFKKPKLKKSSGSVGLSSELPSLDDKNIDYPIFCFKHLHKEYDFDVCKSEDIKFLKGFVTKIKMLCDTSWSNIQLSDRKGIGSEKIDAKSIKASIPPTITKDVNHFLSFYFAGRDGRIVGYRNANIFHVVYIDTKLKVYSHS